MEFESQYGAFGFAVLVVFVVVVVTLGLIRWNKKKGE